MDVIGTAIFHAIRSVFYYFEIKEDNVRQKENQHETET